MKAQKVVINIRIEGLSIDIIDAMVSEAVDRIKREYENGVLEANDGDKVEWQVTKTNVEF